MRIEDLSLSAFVAGTAIGYLIWYWARRGGEVQELRQTRFQATAILVCAFILLALFFGFGFDAVHQTAAGWPFAMNYWFLAVVALIVAASLGILIRDSISGHGMTVPYTKVFQATLGIIFGFILALIVIVLIWGPHSFYLHTVDRWIEAAPLGALLLGILFGSVGAEWLNYILVPAGLRTVGLETQHKRWGFVLLTLLLLGLLYPLFPELLSKLNSANVTTPLGGLSFSLEPISTIRQPHGQSQGEEISETRIWDGFKKFKEMATRDHEYSNIFYRGKLRELTALKTLHDSSYEFVEEVLDPLGNCLDAYFISFHNRELIHRRFEVAIISYTKLLHPPKSGPVDAQDLLDQLAKAATALKEDLVGTELSEKACDKAQQSIEGAKHSITTTLPYTAMGLSFLLYDSGETEQAMREIASWVEDHYLTTGQEKIEECNRKENGICPFYAYRPEPISGEVAKWLQLPPWYRVRIEFELTEMLSPTAGRRSTFLASRALVRTIESLFSESEIREPYAWAKCGSNTAIHANIEKEEEGLESRMAVAYFSLVDKMLRNLTVLADQGLLDDQAAISPEMLRYAEENSAVDLRCLTYLADRTGDRRSYDGEFKATYGILLAQAILRREFTYRISDFERAGRNEVILNARTALRYAIPILQERVSDHILENSRKRLDARLFSLPEEQDYLRRAQSALDNLEALAR